MASKTMTRAEMEKSIRRITQRITQDRKAIGWLCGEPEPMPSPRKTKGTKSKKMAVRQARLIQAIKSREKSVRDLKARLAALDAYDMEGTAGDATGITPKVSKSVGTANTQGLDAGQAPLEESALMATRAVMSEICQSDEPSPQKPTPAPISDIRPASKFYASNAWKKARYRFLTRHERRCVCCGATPAHGAMMTVDHIRPRSLYPELALDPANFQILCLDCNQGKGDSEEYELN